MSDSKIKRHIVSIEMWALRKMMRNLLEERSGILSKIQGINAEIEKIEDEISALRSVD